MSLRIHRDLIEQIRAHGAETYDEECCGILIGREDHMAGQVPDDILVSVIEARRIANSKEGERQRRFIIDPLEILAIEDELEGSDRRIVGYYHSHPDHPAKPSEFDRQHAWPGLSYLILAVEKGEPKALTSWRLSEDRTEFRLEPVHAMPATKPRTADPRTS
ncbi:MAG: M67 family metallopeptidase [Euryarchaeota archaeon]|nr:M67 family metallopeptidase [Euryarchaeota archaeon]